VRFVITDLGRRRALMPDVHPRRLRLWSRMAQSMSGCPALAVPAGFGSTGLPIGIQIIAPDHRELDCLQLAYAYTMAANWTNSRLPALLAA
jgi:Asp-tRNA(Asn)/Glu-tRNA(Gln) amidotransferase A subunit family amidase